MFVIVFSADSIRTMLFEYVLVFQLFHRHSVNKDILSWKVVKSICIYCCCGTTTVTVVYVCVGVGVHVGD